MLKKTNLKAMAFALCATTMAGLYAAPVFAATDELVGAGDVASKVIVTGGAFDKNASISMGIGTTQAVEITKSQGHTSTTIRGDLMLDAGGSGDAVNVGKVIAAQDVAIGNLVTATGDASKDITALENEVFGTKVGGTEIPGLVTKVEDNKKDIDKLKQADVGLDDRLTDVEDATKNITSNGTNTRVGGELTVDGDLKAGNFAVDGTSGKVFANSGLSVIGGAQVSGTLEVETVEVANAFVAPTLQGDNVVAKDSIVVGFADEKNVVLDDDGNVRADANISAKGDMSADGMLTVGTGEKQVTVEDGVLTATNGDLRDKITVGDGEIQLGSKNNGVNITNSQEEGPKLVVGSKNNGVTVNQGNIDATGKITAKDGMDVEGGLAVKGGAAVEGGAEINGGMDVNGGAYVKDGLRADALLVDKGVVVGEAVVAGALVSNGDAMVAGDALINNNADIGGNATIWGDAAVDKDLAVKGTLSAADGKFTVDAAGNTDVKGTLDVTGKATLKDDLQVNGDTVMDGTLNVKDNADFDKDVNIDGKLDVTGKATLKDDLQVNGNTVMDGTLNVKGDADFDKNINVDGNAVIDGTLSAANGNFTVDAEGNTNVEGTLDVTGKATLKDDLQVNGDTVMDGTLNVKDNADFDKDVNIDGKLDVTGKATLKDDLQVNGDTVMDGTLNVKDDADFDKNINVDGNAVIDGTLSAANGNFTVDAEGNTNVEGTLDVTGKATLKDDLQVNGDTVMDGTLNVKDNADFDANVNIDGTLDVTKDATFKADTQTNGTATFGTAAGDKTVIDGGTATVDKKVVVAGTTTIDKDVTIADPEYSGEEIKLSELGQIDNVDEELANEMDNNMYYGDSLEAGVAHNAVNAINAEAQIRRREIDRLDTKIESVGAMSAAIANLRTMGYDPAAPSEFSMSVGHYRGETAMAAGFFHYPNKDFMVSMSVSYGHDELMGGVGATWKFGHRSPSEIARIERERQAEKAMVAAEKAAEAEEADRVAAQAARHQAMLEAEE